jgi:uncharacterized protein GlcG (DUF336 family)
VNKQEYGPPISLAQTKKVLVAAESAATANQWSVVIAVTDSAGHMTAMVRMDNAHLGSINVARLKAQTAVNFKCPTKTFEDALAAGTLRLLALDNFCPIEGGVPLYDDGKLVGAIGVSGAKADQDGVIAAAGAQVLSV